MQRDLSSKTNNWEIGRVSSARFNSSNFSLCRARTSFNQNKSQFCIAMRSLLEHPTLSGLPFPNKAVLLKAVYLPISS